VLKQAFDIRSRNAGAAGRWFLFAALLCSVACNDIPVDSLHESFSIKVTQSQKNKDAVKVDFLWVIDNSSSMCQEQASLATAFDDFIDKVESFVALDYRIAVVTTDVKSKGHKGQFRHHLASESPFACGEIKIQPCFPLEGGDDTCEEAFGNHWICHGYSGDFTNRTVNCNGTINSECRKICSADAECDEEFFGEEAAKACLADPSQCKYKCVMPGGTDPKASACVLRPQTQGCPSTEDMKGKMLQKTGTVPYMTMSNARALFKCVGTVGADQGFNANWEQGIQASLLALDKNGINAEQAKAFLRDDAYLVVVYVSDEDDCSSANPNSLIPDDYGQCMCLKDSTEGGPLLPVDQAVNKLKSLKSDPGRVLVASIVGDSTGSTPEEIEVDRTAYFDSKCGFCADNKEGKHGALHLTFVCSSAAGTADYGSRYVQFANRFGQNGIVTNICSDTGFGPALETIADQIILVFSKVCLPRPIKTEESLVVRKVGPEGTCADNSPCNVVEGDKACGGGGVCTPTVTPLAQSTVKDTPTYQLVVSSECKGDSGNQAIFLNFLLEPGTEVEVEYVADPGFGDTL
jgi:hypothetical protein